MTDDELKAFVNEQVERIGFADWSEWPEYEEWWYDLARSVAAVVQPLYADPDMNAIARFVDEHKRDRDHILCLQETVRVLRQRLS